MPQTLELSLDYACGDEISGGVGINSAHLEGL
jgi:hypothetical protein